jgi:hypothetical protein
MLDVNGILVKNKHFVQTSESGGHYEEQVIGVFALTATLDEIIGRSWQRGYRAPNITLEVIGNVETEYMKELEQERVENGIPF